MDEENKKKIAKPFVQYLLKFFERWDVLSEKFKFAVPCISIMRVTLVVLFWFSVYCPIFEQIYN